MHRILIVYRELHMRNAPADYRKAIQIALPFLAALAVVSMGRMSAQAQSNHMLVIPASDGYGFDDCLSNGKACGQTIADAWCEAHGMAASVSFGRADDVTASTPKTGDSKTASTKLDPGSFIVNCKD